MQQPPYYNQQPPGPYGYPPQFPPQMPPPKRTFWQRFQSLPLIIRAPIYIFLIIFVGSAAISAIHDQVTPPATVQATPVVEVSRPVPTVAPTQHIATWTTIQTFTGHTHDKTPYFTIKPGWRIKWKCTNSTVPSGDTGGVGITAYDHAGNTLSGNADDPTVATGHCPPTFFGTTGTSDVQKYGGTMYLDVYVSGDWTIDIQELK